VRGLGLLLLSKAGEKPSRLPLWALSYSDTKNQLFVKLAGPALGAIAVKKRNGGGHVTFVAGRTRGGALACCGGNQNDEVNISPYREDVLVGFFWPKRRASTRHWLQEPIDRHEHRQTGSREKPSY
jgi:uncharacterized protein (TIGR02594 family)